MRTALTLAVIVGGALVAPAWAQEANDAQSDRSERRQRVLAAFDADGDGELSDEERDRAREELGERGQRGQRGGGERGDRPGRGPRPEGPPDFGRMFDRFDENDDDQLSRDEFTKLTAALREMRERRGPGGPEGERGRAGRDDRPGRPEDGDRPSRRRGEIGDGEDFRPLQNPGPPRGEERGYRGSERGSRARGGGEGRGPHPERLFRAFDENGDDQLSRTEFRAMTESIRERMADMRGRGYGPGPREGGRRSRGPDGEGPPRPPRPPRPEFESADPPEPAADSNSA